MIYRQMPGSADPASREKPGGWMFWASVRCCLFSGYLGLSRARVMAIGRERCKGRLENRFSSLRSAYSLPNGRPRNPHDGKQSRIQSILDCFTLRVTNDGPPFEGVSKRYILFSYRCVSIHIGNLRIELTHFVHKEGM
jgi:hypothetical protein